MKILLRFIWGLILIACGFATCYGNNVTDVWTFIVEGIGIIVMVSGVSNIHSAID